MNRRARDAANDSILALFHELDAETEAFAAATGLRCPTGCGACCESPAIHCAAVEFEPLARAFVDAGTAEAALERAAEAGAGPCIFYAADGPGRGRCTVYAYRPAVCRLFGFAAVRGKRGHPELAACRRHKAEQPEAVARAHEQVATGAPVPLMGVWQTRAAELGTSTSGALLPINQAIATALERALMLTAFASADAPASETAEGAAAASAAIVDLAAVRAAAMAARRDGPEDDEPHRPGHRPRTRPTSPRRAA